MDPPVFPELRKYLPRMALLGGGGPQVFHAECTANRAGVGSDRRVFPGATPACRAVSVRPVILVSEVLRSAAGTRLPSDRSVPCL